VGPRDARATRQTTRARFDQLTRALHRGTVPRDRGSSPSGASAMGLLVNSKGHPNTLVASQHGNRNAVKSGVFSPAVIGSRVEERERDVELLQPQELISDVLTSEIARLLVIRDAMDEALEEEGLRGRRGEPRTMLALRLRLNTACSRPSSNSIPARRGSRRRSSRSWAPRKALQSPSQRESPFSTGESHSNWFRLRSLIRSCS
jgi:hypothetical protein